MNSKLLRWSVYLTAAMLIVFPVVETLVAVWPLRLGTMTWRYGTTGLVSRSLMTPILGMVTLLVASYKFENRPLCLTLFGVSLLAGLGLLGIGALFILDALQLRVSTAEALEASFTASAAIAFAKVAFSALVMFAISRAGWAGWKAGKRRR